MVVVSDTTPVNYLLLIGEIDLLQQLFGRVLLPQAVVTELLHPDAPFLVSAWAASLPAWIEVKTIIEVDPAYTLASLHLGPGEQEALTLAKQEKAGLIILDERRARNVAQLDGLTVTGTLGIIEMAAKQGLVDLNNALTALQKTSIYLSPELTNSILKRNNLAK